jgi:HK97 family phage prohead protease
MDELRQLIGTPTSRVTGLDERAVGRTDDEGRRVFTALAYDINAVDTYGTTMAPGALRAAEGGVPLLLFHNRASFPVGKIVGWDHTDRGPEARFVFADTEEARTAEALVASGFLRGVSVGFIPSDGFVREDGVVVFTDAEVVEMSLTPTPSSRGALVDLQRSIADLVGSAGSTSDETPAAADAPANPLSGETEDRDLTIDEAMEKVAEAHDEYAAKVQDIAAELDADAERAATVAAERARTMRTISRIRRTA